MSDTPREKQRLLIVDDSKVIRVTARKILRDHFETLEAVDGENAWDILSGDPPVSLVVSDLTMPNLDGFGLLKRIRSSNLAQIRELPVIIITGANDTDATMERARQAGATDFIGKPFDAVHLLARTQAHANSHAVTNTLKEENTALEEKSTLDPLTGLANEAAFMERGYQQLSYAIRHNSTLTLFRMEIDGYDAIYRQYGASFSQSIIQTLAKTLSPSIRQEDTVARIGTARFAMLLPAMDKAGVRSLAERINSSIATRVFKSGNDKATVTVSIGVASPKIRRDMQLSELITVADDCLSEAISRGGNTVIYDDEPVRARTSAQTMRAMLSEHKAKNHAKAVFAETEPPTLANTGHVLHGEEMDVEEIEIFTPGFAYSHFGATGAKAAEMKCQSNATSGRVSDTHAGPVPGEDATRSAAAAAKPSDVPPSEWTVIPVDPEDSVDPEKSSPEDDKDITVVLTPLFAHTTEGQTREAKEASGADRMRPKNARHGTIKPARHPRRPGILKRMFTWLGLARSRH